MSLDLDFLRDFLGRAAAVLLCLTVHESCHALAAWGLGDATARRRRRLSLNPLRHIDWLGLAMLLTVGFGWAKPVPVDPRQFKRPKLGMALTALAGPASNLALAFLAVWFGNTVLPRWITGQEGAAYWLYLFLHLELAPLSIGLGMFNLLPVPPLDGAKVLGAFLPERTYFGLMRYERYGLVVLLALSWLGVTGGLVSRGVYGVYRFFLGVFL